MENDKLVVIGIGDMHETNIRPKFRQDDFVNSLSQKIRDVANIAKEYCQKEYKVIYALTGDLFNSARPGIDIVFQAINHLSLLALYGDIFITIGNHDELGFNLKAYNKTMLALLPKLTNKLHVLDSTNTAENTMNHFKYEDMKFIITGHPYIAEIDTKNYNAYNHNIPINSQIKPEQYFIYNIVHGMLIDYELPMNNYTHVNNVESNCNFILSGHDHKGYGYIKKSEKLSLCNPGSFIRSTVAESDIRDVCISLLEINTVKREIESHKLYKLPNQLSYNEILNVDYKIEKEKKKELTKEFSKKLDINIEKQDVMKILNQVIVEMELQENEKNKVFEVLETVNQHKKEKKLYEND